MIHNLYTHNIHVQTESTVMLDTAMCSKNIFIMYIQQYDHTFVTLHNLHIISYCKLYQRIYQISLLMLRVADNFCTCM